MKLGRISLTVIALMLILAVLASSALAASTLKTLSTNFTLVNLGSLTADVQVEYLLSSGDPWPNVNPANKNFTLAADGGQIQIRQYADTMSPGAGSAVVSSSQPLGAIVQIQARNQVSTTGAYKGDNVGSSSFYVPLLARRASSASGTVNSQIIVQNAGTDPVNFEVILKPATGFSGTYTKTVTGLARGVSFYYDLDTETNLPEGWFGSAVVNATSLNGSLSVVANVFSGADGLQTYNAFSKESLGNKWLIPIFTSRLTNGLSTVVTLQNLTGGTLNATAVTLNCKQDGTLTPKDFSNPVQILDQASYSFNPVSGGATYPDNWFGSCVLNAPGNVVVFVQMRVVGIAGISNVAAYEALNGSGTSTSVFVPLIAKRLSNGFATVVNISNLSADPNTITLSYIPSPTECPVAFCDKSGNGTVGPEDSITPADAPITIPGNGGIQRNQRTGEPDLPLGWVGSLKITSTSNKPINSVVQLTNVNLLPGDTLMAHGSFGN